MGDKEATCEEPRYPYNVSQQTGQENPHAPAHHEAVLKKDINSRGHDNTVAQGENYYSLSKDFSP